jgi:hypothetical protein
MLNSKVYKEKSSKLPSIVRKHFFKKKITFDIVFLTRIVNMQDKLE